MSKAWWTGFMLKNLPALQRECPFLADEPIDGSDLPILQELTVCYAELCATRAGLEAREAGYALERYHALDGTTKARFHPKGLPRATKFIALREMHDMLQNDADVYSPPASRKLAEIMKHAAYHAHYDGLGRLDAGTDAATITAAGGRELMREGLVEDKRDPSKARRRAEAGYLRLAIHQ